MKTNKFAEDAEIIQFSMKGNVFPLVRVIKLKLMENVRDVIFMTLIVVNVTKMDVKSVKTVFI